LLDDLTPLSGGLDLHDDIYLELVIDRMSDHISQPIAILLITGEQYITTLDISLHLSKSQTYKHSCKRIHGDFVMSSDIDAADDADMC
jgi:hypothetical protein